MAAMQYDICCTLGTDISEGHVTHIHHKQRTHTVSNLVYRQLYPITFLHTCGSNSHLGKYSGKLIHIIVVFSGRRAIYIPMGQALK